MKIDELGIRKRIGQSLFRNYRENAQKLHKLNYIFWECTLRCNLSCVHCGSDCKKEAAVPDMPIDDFIRAIDDVTPIVEPNKTTIVFTGGEPLMRKDLEVCGKQLNERGYPWGIVSNGMLLTKDRLISMLRAGMHSLTISLDGFSHAHNWMRGNRKSFDRAFAAVQLAAQVPKLAFDVVTCVNQNSFKDLEAFKMMLIEAGVKRWRVFTIFPVGRAKEHPELQLKPKQFKQLFEFIAEVRKEGKIKLNYGCEGYLGAYETEVRDQFFFCRAGVNIGSVLVDGSISACPSLRDGFIQGNIYEDSFRDVWENRYENMRNRKWMKQGKCADCKKFAYCEGSGLHLRDEKSGDILFCHYERIKEGEDIACCSE